MHSSFRKTVYCGTKYDAMIYQFKIQIKGITKPPVWRKVAVPGNFTFLKFHDVIQAAFGWEDYHLFHFVDKEYGYRLCISMPEEEDFDVFNEPQDASKVKLSDIFSDHFRKLLYVYDFGDDWVHEITLEAVSEVKQKKAVCLSGKGACPPEDCGGVYGYENMKAIFRESSGEEVESYREWLGLEEGENWDPTSFDIDEVNDYLKEL